MLPLTSKVEPCQKCFQDAIFFIMKYVVMFWYIFIINAETSYIYTQLAFAIKKKQHKAVLTNAEWELCAACVEEHHWALVPQTVAQHLLVLLYQSLLTLKEYVKEIDSSIYLPPKWPNDDVIQQHFNRKLWWRGSRT